LVSWFIELLIVIRMVSWFIELLIVIRNFFFCVKELFDKHAINKMYLSEFVFISVFSVLTHNLFDFISISCKSGISLIVIFYYCSTSSLSV